MNAAIAALRAATRRMGYSLPALVAETGIWAHPDEHARRVSADNPSGAAYPRVRRARLGSGEALGTTADGVRLDRNNYAGHAIRHAVAASRPELQGYEACHIWPGSCYDARYHTVLANLVLVPGPIASLTDHDPDVISALQFRAFELYTWHPTEEAPPTKPDDYPINWREPIARAPRRALAAPSPTWAIAPRGSGPSHREYMRMLYGRLSGARDEIIRAYADAEERGEVRRTSNTTGMSAINYARRLWADGIKHGWLEP